MKDNPDFDGTLHFIFQPAEEGAKGAKAMITDGLFEKVQVDMVFGIHNWPYLPKGTMATRTGPIMAAADKLDITIQGKGGHAAWPQECIDPVVAGAQLVQAAQMIASRNVNPLEAVVISITQFHGGSGAFNVIPDTVTLKGTIRSFTPETRELAHTRLKDICEGVAKATGTQIECDILLGTDATINSRDGVEIAGIAAMDVFGDENIDLTTEPVMGAEDFGAFLQYKPGAFAFIGQAESDPQSAHNNSLHSPHYDFNDGIIPDAVAYFTRIVKTALPVKE
jgi:hippurate hydrolase